MVGEGQGGREGGANRRRRRGESDEWRERAGGRGEVWMRGKARRGEGRERAEGGRGGLTDAKLAVAGGRWREGSAGFPFWAEKGKPPSLPSAPAPPACLPAQFSNWQSRRGS